MVLFTNKKSATINRLCIEYYSKDKLILTNLEKRIYVGKIDAQTEADLAC
jgi:hypothetical protein